MNETVEENKNKFKLRRPNRKWTDAETVKILEFITDTGYKFEKPTQLTYYNAMRDELKIDVTWSMLKFKVLSLKSSYKNVRKWREDLINAGLSAHEVEMSKTNAKLFIKCEEDEPHPHCAHGPTLLFCHEHAVGANDSEVKEVYFACAAHRDKRACTFHLAYEDLSPQKLQRRYETPADQYREERKRFLSDGDASVDRHFCLDCNVPLLNAELALHDNHNVAPQLTPQQLCDPTQFLSALDNDKANAQYFFDQRALRFFAQSFRDLGVTKVICMGAPRLHAFLRTHFATEVQSFLLDFDHRFFYFFPDEQFAWYNMCNNYFFDETQKLSFCTFLRSEPSDRLLIFTDPPFGCRTEPIAHTLRKLTRRYNAINGIPLHQPLPIFWVFPYYAENYIKQQMPSLEMSDYRVNYTNHAAYTDCGEGSRSIGSPVRLFTNVPSELLRLPITEEYKYCDPCRRYTALTNHHCKRCGCCPAKNGARYRHCERCGVCVKPSYVHCMDCRRCTQRDGHDCRSYQSNQRCWICRRVGHTENKCTEWSKRLKVVGARKAPALSKKIMCLLCGQCGHNEQRCLQRDRYIEETTFLGETQFQRFKV